MPFGLCYSLATFERLIECILSRVPRTECVVYLYDLLLHMETFEMAMQNMKKFLKSTGPQGFV